MPGFPAFHFAEQRRLRPARVLAVLTLAIAFDASLFAQQVPDESERPPWRGATPAAARLESWRLHQRLREQSPHRELAWRPIGPRMAGGRIESIACPPGKPSVMYVGVGSGGLWKTVNNGTTWKPIFDDQATLAIGDVAVSRSNPDVVWVGTGEVLMARSALPGVGVFKSSDGGDTWSHVGLEDTHHIGRVLVDHQDPDTVFVAAIGHRSSGNEQRGVFKTTDGGKSWKKVLYLGESVSAMDLVFDPVDCDTLYATTWQRDLDGQDHYGAGSGIHKSQDGGETWRELTSGLPREHGGSSGRIAIDVAPSNSRVVYALMDNAVYADEKPRDVLLRSDDSGETWKQVNDRSLRAGWDWCEIRVSPNDENEVYSIGQNSYVSRDGGVTFEQLGGTIVHMLPHNSTVLHLDTHCMWIDPENSDHLVFGNDGGLYVSYDRGATWLHVNTLPISECYAVTYDMRRPFNVYVGTQDNAALFGSSAQTLVDGGQDEWTQVYLDRWGGGDSYFTFRDPTNDDTIYYEHQYGDLKRKDMATGEVRGIQPRPLGGEPPLRFAWMTPYFPSSHDGATLYLGANHVFKSVDRGDHWERISPDLAEGEDTPNLRYKAITTLAESKLRRGLLYAGTDNGRLFRTLDDGGHWTPIDAALPRCGFTRVFPSPHDEQVVWATQTGMATDDFSPYIFRSDDQGETWRSLAAELPLEPIHVVLEDPNVPGLVYVGTDLGVYVSRDGGAHWESLCGNLPPASVQDLFVHPRDKQLVIGTHGRSVYVLDVASLQGG